MRRGFGATWVCDLVHCSESLVASDLFAVRLSTLPALPKAAGLLSFLPIQIFSSETKSGTVHPLAFRGSLLKLTVGLVELNG